MIMGLLIWCQTCKGHYPADMDNTWVHDGKLYSKCKDCGTKKVALIHISSSEDKHLAKKRSKIQYG
jgi:hypothetical protein